MFHPADRPMERGWVGRVDADRVVHLAAQTLQHFFSGGASAREHADYALGEVEFLAPVLHPPAVRIFETERSFAFANPAAVGHPGGTVALPPAAESLVVLLRPAAVIGAEGTIGGYTLLAEWRAPALEQPKDRDFALRLGPLVATADELHGPVDLVGRVDGAERLRTALVSPAWEQLAAFAAAGTVLRTGDILAGPAAGEIGGLGTGATVELDAGPTGVLAARVSPRP
jgi:hypothetical protein